MNTDEHRLNLLTEQIIGCAFTVSNHYGCGLLEKPYRNSLAVELRHNGLFVEIEKKIEIFYRGLLVGEYFADLVVENTVMIETKAVQSLDDVHAAQCLNYLKLTGYPICLLLNFGRPKLEIKRYRGTIQA